MKQIDERRYEAESGCTFVHKTDKTRMGDRLYLGDSDTIENYGEEPMTEDEILAIENEKKQHEERPVKRRK